ncbi:MAG TPA: cytochrome C [Nitrospirota bacterium]
MKGFIILAKGLLIALCLLGAAREAAAFHDGGAGACEGCHTMHNSSDGVPLGAMNAYLLKAQDPSSTCLHCHQQAGDVGPTAYHISTPESEMPAGVPPKQLTPGGDFGWLRKNYSWIPGAGLPVLYSYGDRHGHNIVAGDYLYSADGAYATAPGGTYPSASLSCTSCHDPHGKYRRNADGTFSTSGPPIVGSGSFAQSPSPGPAGSVGVYAMLAGKNYQPKSLVGGYIFYYDPPDAVAPGAGTGDSNRSEAATQTRVAYGRGMSEWCRNCHPNMHTPAYPGSANLTHPAGNTARLGSLAAVYNQYVNAGNLSGTSATSYLSLVPFEEGTGDYTALKSHAKTDDTYLAGPDNTYAQVMCLTCHRAHASGWDGIMRWNSKTSYMVYNGLYAQEGQMYQLYGQGRTETEATRAYYNKSEKAFALNQDTLCRKCHTADPWGSIQLSW